LIGVAIRCRRDHIRRTGVSSGPISPARSRRSELQTPSSKPQAPTEPLLAIRDGRRSAARARRPAMRHRRARMRACRVEAESKHAAAGHIGNARARLPRRLPSLRSSCLNQLERFVPVAHVAPNARSRRGSDRYRSESDFPACGDRGRTPDMAASSRAVALWRRAHARSTRGEATRNGCGEVPDDMVCETVAMQHVLQSGGRGSRRPSQ
jgi:hypothetical protein